GRGSWVMGDGRGACSGRLLSRHTDAPSTQHLAPLRSTSTRPGSGVSTEQLRVSRALRRERLTLQVVEAIAERLLGPARGTARRVSESAARELRRMDRECDFTPSARSAFQDLLAWTGQPTVHAISLPA